MDQAVVDLDLEGRRRRARRRRWCRRRRCVRRRRGQRRQRHHRRRSRRHRRGSGRARSRARKRRRRCAPSRRASRQRRRRPRARRWWRKRDLSAQPDPIGGRTRRRRRCGARPPRIVRRVHRQAAIRITAGRARLHGFVAAKTSCRPRAIVSPEPCRWRVVGQRRAIRRSQRASRRPACIRARQPAAQPSGTRVSARSRNRRRAVCSGRSATRPHESGGSPCGSRQARGRLRTSRRR